MQDFKIGDSVFFTAFVKPRTTEFYTCIGTILSIYEESAKLKITAVASHPVFVNDLDPQLEEDYIIRQAGLLGRVISKRENECFLDLHTSMVPNSWIKIVKE